MEKIVEQTLLFDFYGELLTEHQQRIYKDAVFNDLSASEIAKNEGISRQGAHDLIRRCDKILKGYESRLKLVEKFLSIREHAKAIKALARDGKGATEAERFADIDTKASAILNEL